MALRILGISAYFHDSAAALVVDGQIVAAAQEERFSRRKFDSSFPSSAAKYCLAQAQIGPEHLDYVVFYDKPFLKFERLLETYLAFAPRGFRTFSVSMPAWVKDKLFQKGNIIAELRRLWGAARDWERCLRFSEHHLSHAASAFFPSPFAEAAILTLDGVGEWATTTFAQGRDNRIWIEKELHFPHSLGLLYSAFTYYTGFKVNSGEYKMMGLAPYGRPKYVKLIKENLIDIREDGTYALDISYFDFCTGLTMTSNRFHELFGGVPRKAEARITQRDMDLAASIQAVTEEVLIKLASGISRTSGRANLCLAGGVALNCVANGRLLREQMFERIWIQPAAGDSGGALGAALSAYHIMLDQPRRTDDALDGMNGAYLGPEYDEAEVVTDLTLCGAKFIVYSEEELIERTAQALAAGKAVGWMNGRMEFGSRALGNRSILADPRSPTMQRLLNRKIKYRESFRPFAPSVLREDVGEWFELDIDSPYMLFVADVARAKRFEVVERPGAQSDFAELDVQRSSIPAVTHVDNSARVQTVRAETNPRFHKLLKRFKDLTGCPVLVNTSFNVRGEPIVCSPTDAYRCFMGTDLDLLVIGNALVEKSEQVVRSDAVYKHKYELD